MNNDYKTENNAGAKDASLLYKSSIAVVIPVYNSEKWLSECIDSVLEQTVQFDQIIVVNDGSTDGSLSILKKYGDVNKRIIIVNQVNKGSGLARNAAIKLVDSEYFMFLDSDDYLESNTVETLKESLEQKRFDLIYFNGKSFFDGICCEALNYDRRIEQPVYDVKGMDFFLYMYPRHYFASACLCLYRTEYIRNQKIIFSDYRFYEDIVYTYRCMLEAQKVAYIPASLYRRRYRPNSKMTQSVGMNHILDAFRMLYSLIAITNNKTNKVSVIELQFILDRIKWVRGIMENDNLTDQDKEKIALLDVEMKTKLDKIIEGKYEKYSDWNTGILFSYLTLYREADNNNALEILIKKYRPLLEKTDMNKAGHRIGIYGTGKHTEGFLYMYKNLIGDIKADVSFIETNPKTEKYLGYNVIASDKIDETYDMIVISSFYYKDEIEESIRRRLADIKIVDFYSDIYTDIFATAHEVLDK